MPSAVPKMQHPRAARPPWAVLLDQFYARAGLEAPHLRELDPEAVPQPYHSLLVHSRDMTPTLEAFYHQPIALKVLSRDLDAQSYLREVVLLRTDGGGPIEYGVIRICLNHLTPVAARRVLEAERPFGNILQSEAIPHLSWPQAFFCAESDPHIRGVLALTRTGLLYGRRNVLLDSSRRLLAEVIEILSPVSPSDLGANGHERPSPSA